MPGSGPSELECVVLGVVWKFGPCTPHAIRTHFTSGRNSRFTASAGAIYPLVVRLERKGWLRSRAESRGLQARRLYTIAPAGLRQLRDWLCPASDAPDPSIVHDPLRVRLYFLGALPAAERERFFTEALRGLRRNGVLLREDLARYEEAGVPFSGAAIRGALALVRAQARWLRATRDELGAGPARPAGRKRRPGRTKATAGSA